MKTLHYVLHSFVLCAFVVSAIAFGLLTLDKEILKDASLYGVKKKMVTHSHNSAPMGSIAINGCPVCLDLGLTACIEDMPRHMARLNDREPVSAQPQKSASQSVEETLAVWFNAIFPKNDRANGARQMETESLLSVANWD